MPRTRRADAPGAIHHLMVRGVGRASIFRDDVDRARFVDVLRRLTPEEGAAVYAWALMPNHVHLVLRSGPSGLSRLMARLGTTYALAFNRRHDRVGHLFQNRFKSVLVESDAHFRWLLRYVHRNPIEGRIVPSVEALDDYAWTGHRELVGGAPAPLIAAATVLAWFAPERAAAVHALRRWMGDGDSAADVPPGEAASDPSLVPGAAARAVERASAARGIDPRHVWAGARSRAASAARSLAVLELSERHGLSPTQIERALGLSRGAALRALQRARAVRHQ